MKPNLPSQQLPVREERVAAALRENLRKRKTQAQARAQNNPKKEQKCP